MVIPSVNFLSYNSTGLDSIKADYIRNLYNVTKCDFISIQELNLLTNFLKTIFLKILVMLFRVLEKKTKIVADLRGALLS